MAILYIPDYYYLMVNIETVKAISEPFTVHGRDLSCAENLAVESAARLVNLVEILGNLSVHPDFELAIKERARAVEAREQDRSSDWRTVGSAILELCARANITPKHIDSLISSSEGFVAPVCIEDPDEEGHIVLSHDLAVYRWPEE